MDTLLHSVPEYVVLFRYRDGSTRAVLYGLGTYGEAFTDGNVITAGPDAGRAVNGIARASR